MESSIKTTLASRALGCNHNDWYYNRVFEIWSIWEVMEMSRVNKLWRVHKKIK